MLHSIRFMRPPFAPAPASYLEKIMNGNSSGGGVGRVRLVHATAGEAKSTPPLQDASKQHEDKSGDVMSHSFGDGYSTRSNDDGFGGVYGGNDPDTNDGDGIICEHPDYDKSQGSEVAEKEKARHQKTAES
ncbi:hypothetical protein AKJ16_DCAP06861 [Drosera capensis]